MKSIMAVLALLSFGTAQAALVDRGGGFIYDDVMNITWTQNMLLKPTTGDWASSMTWASNLSVYDSVRDVTWDDWRLPNANRNGDNTVVDCSTAAQLWCRDNELGYMFKYYQPRTNPLITNYVGNFFWTSTEYKPDPANGAYSVYVDGSPYAEFKWANIQNAWAVRDGDVGASVVPIPAAVWLFASGLGLLGWMKRRTG